jgi:ribosomal protein L34E
MAKKEKAKCEICKRRLATTPIVRPLEIKPINVCMICYRDILEEDD